MTEEIIERFFRETESGEHFEEEENMESILLERTFLKKEKGNMVYIVDDKEVENFDVDHSQGMCGVLDNVDKDTRAYHEPIKTKKVNIGSENDPMEAII